MNLTDESRVILLCARIRMSETQRYELAQLVSRPLDWEQILLSALAQGVAPFLYQNLKLLSVPAGIPQGVMTTLKKTYHENTARNMLLYAELARITNTFHQRGIEGIVLKGAALAKFIYRDIGLRSMIDIDILIQREDLRHAAEIMPQLEYFPETLHASEEWYRQKHHHLPVYTNRANSVSVELHWNIANASTGVLTSSWWKRGIKVQIDHQDATIPSPGDMLMHLCVHLFHHGYPTEMVLRALCDISTTLDRYQEEIDWKAFLTELASSSLRKPVLTVLYLVKKIYDRHERPLENIQLSDINLRLLKILEARMCEEDCGIPVPNDLIKAIATDTFVSKMKLLLPIFFPPREVIAKKYLHSPGTYKLLFYYLVHPLKLFMKYGKSAATLYLITGNKK